MYANYQLDEQCTLLLQHFRQCLPSALVLDLLGGRKSKGLWCVHRSAKRREIEVGTNQWRTVRVCMEFARGQCR